MSGLRDAAADEAVRATLRVEAEHDSAAPDAEATAGRDCPGWIPDPLVDHDVPVCDICGEVGEKHDRDLNAYAALRASLETAEEAIREWNGIATAAGRERDAEREVHHDDHGALGPCIKAGLLRAAPKATTPHERLRDALGKPAASVRDVGGRYLVDVFHDSGGHAETTRHDLEEALDYIREGLCDGD